MCRISCPGVPAETSYHLARSVPVLALMEKRGGSLTRKRVAGCGVGRGVANVCMMSCAVL